LEISDSGFVVRGERRDLHAGIPTRDDEYFAREIGERAGMESHIQDKYLSQCVKI
jgi:hypothetical protein